ncbi:uncharacterized protein [Drosophila kikkawai]|uniref:CCHC-type domain-containing protein n=1 Tax=Drosophila kikkawai TaxID=30033 RepID=A0ABM4GQE6_DROKI
MGGYVIYVCSSHNSGNPPVGIPSVRARILEALPNTPTHPVVSVADLAATLGNAPSQKEEKSRGDAAAFRKSSLLAHSPPLVPPSAPERSAVGDPTDSVKRGRDPASPTSGSKGTLPKRSKAAQEEAVVEVEQERTLTRNECVTKLGKLLDELHGLVHEKQVRHINIAMKAMIAEMRKLKTGIEQSAVEPERRSEPESVCCRCSQILPAGKLVENKAQKTAVVPRKDRAVQTDPWRRVSQQDGIAGASHVPRQRRTPLAQATARAAAPAAPRNGAKKARPDAPAMPRVPERRHESVVRPPEPEPVTAGNSWSTVAKKRNQTRRARPDAVVVEAPGKSYSEILALVTRREDRQLTDLGGAVTKVRRMARGNLLLEVARGSTESAESMRDSISRVLGDAAEVRALTEESKVCVFEIRNLDAIATEKEIRTALAEQYQLCDGAVRIRSLRPGYGDSKTAVFSLPCSMAKEVRRLGKVRIGWTICRVREREGPPRCFRCLELGHIAIRCKSLVDKSGIKCGEAGHKAVACKKEPVILPASSGEANVRPGSKSRQAGRGAAQDLLMQTVREVATDVAILSEPYRASVGGEWAKDRSGKAALWLCGDRRLRMSNIQVADGFVRAEVGGYCIYSCYLAPSLPLEVFSGILDDLSSDLRGRPKVIVGGDFNAWAQEWGSVSTNARGRAVLEAFASTDVVLLNDGERHTFVRAGAVSIIDLTFVSGAISQTARWGFCDAYTGSDHEAILCSVGGPERAALRPSKAYRPDTLCTQAFTNALDSMAAEATGGANEMANRIATTLEHACDQSMRQRGSFRRNHRPVFWWSDVIADLRSTCLRARRQLTRARGTSRRA